MSNLPVSWTSRPSLSSKESFWWVPRQTMTDMEAPPSLTSK